MFSLEPRCQGLCGSQKYTAMLVAMVKRLWLVEATLRGHLEGSIRADKVVLCASCNVKGDVVHARIVIEDGARFEGNFRPSLGPTP